MVEASVVLANVNAIIDSTLTFDDLLKSRDTEVLYFENETLQEILEMIGDKPLYFFGFLLWFSIAVFFSFLIIYMVTNDKAAKIIMSMSIPFLFASLGYFLSFFFLETDYIISTIVTPVFFFVSLLMSALLFTNNDANSRLKYSYEVEPQVVVEEKIEEEEMNEEFVNSDNMANATVSVNN